MKKILPILLAIIAVLLPFAPSSAFAEESTNLISGKDFYLTSYENFEDYSKPVSQLTDGDENTSVTVVRKSEAGEFAFLKLDEPSTITSFVTVAGYSGLRFYDASFNMVGSSATNSLYKQTVRKSMTMRNVSYIALDSVYTGTSDQNKIFEVEVYGYVTDTKPPGKVSGMDIAYEDDIPKLTWTNPSDSDLDHIVIYRDGEEIGTTSKEYFIDETAVFGKLYTYAFEAVDTSGNRSDKQAYMAEFEEPDKTPPANVRDLSETHDDKTATLKWTNPTDEDFSAIRIYKNGTLLTTLGKVSTFKVEDLKPLTSYNFKVTSLDLSGNESSGSTISLDTLKEIDRTPPSYPTDLSVKTGSQVLYLNWNAPSDKDVKGYNVYMNGKKINSSLVTSESFRASNLENEKEYTFQVSAVDTSGNESILSAIATGTPKADAMPLMEFGDYDLKDVGSSIASWFSSLWLIIVFAVAIPLSFYIASRIKALFVG